VDGASSDLVTELVRITARVSAVIFVASLLAGTAELLAPRSSFSRRGAGWKLLGALLVSHTIHFATVIALTVETHAQNIAHRGGWILAIGIGLFFYASTVGALVLRRGPPVARTIPNLAGDAALSGLVWLAFLITYLGRIGRSPLFAVMVVLLSGAMFGFVAAVAVRIVRQVTPSPVRGHVSHHA
jgi:hypothetical protein